MSATVPLQSINKVLGWLQDSVDEWLSEGHSLSGIYIVLPSGFSIDLNNISIPSISAFNGVRIRIDDITINIPKVMLQLVFPQFNWLFDSSGSILNTAIPGSEHWEFAGPLRQDQWPPKAGTEFSPIEYYRLWHLGIDVASIVMVISIVYALNKVGLIGLANKLVSRALTGGSALPSNELKDIKDKVDSVSDDMITNTNTDWLLLISQISGIVGVVNAILGNMVNVYKILTNDETTTNIINDLDSDIMLKFSELNESLSSNITLLDSWLQYLDLFSLWLANPIGNERPVRPS